MKNFKPDYLIIPRIITKDEDIPPAGGLVYGAIYLYAQLKENKCTASNESIAQAACVSKGTASNMISKLRKKDYIKCSYKTDKRQERVSIEPLIKYGRVSLNNEGGLHQTMKGASSNNEQNNKRNNKNKNNSGSSDRSSQEFPKEKYDKVTEAYKDIKGVEPKGSEWKPIQQEIKTMFMNERTPEQIISFMQDLEESDEEWTKSWTIHTVRKKMHEYLAGNLELKGRKSQTYEY